MDALLILLRIIYVGQVPKRFRVQKKICPQVPEIWSWRWSWQLASWVGPFDMTVDRGLNSNNNGTGTRSRWCQWRQYGQWKVEKFTFSEAPSSPDSAVGEPVRICFGRVTPPLPTPKQKLLKVAWMWLFHRSKVDHFLKTFSMTGWIVLGRILWHNQSFYSQGPGAIFI